MEPLSLQSDETQVPIRLTDVSLLARSDFAGHV